MIFLVPGSLPRFCQSASYAGPVICILGFWTSDEAVSNEAFLLPPNLRSRQEIDVRDRGLARAKENAIASSDGSPSKMGSVSVTTAGDKIHPVGSVR